MAEATGFRNSSLQGGLSDTCGARTRIGYPMSGFDNARVDREFFFGTNIKSKFICSLGHGDPTSLFPRRPRLSLEEAGRFA
jgi:3-hydroxypropanoate dehydrogenase